MNSEYDLSAGVTTKASSPLSLQTTQTGFLSASNNKFNNNKDFYWIRSFNDSVWWNCLKVCVAGKDESGCLEKEKRDREESCVLAG